MLIVLTQLYSKRSQKIFTCLTICLSLMLLSACATTVDKMDQLDRTLKGYEKALRWARFDMAYSFHKWDTKELPTIPAHLKNIRLTSYKVSNSSFDEITMTAKQNVTLRFYSQDDPRERTLETKQSWKYFPANKRWYLMNEPPTFK